MLVNSELHSHQQRSQRGQETNPADGVEGSPARLDHAGPAKISENMRCVVCENPLRIDAGHERRDQKEVIWADCRVGV
ncbi:hypothetical protein HYDPIDRAFT_108208 [Hydnomerulius pinastri MD-312]|nr:hypothetical protein HYDPIDRAFT_108208 [Hydnomerulius pinastri MD-312]